MVNYSFAVPKAIHIGETKGDLVALRDAFDMCRCLEKEGSTRVQGNVGADIIVYEKENFDQAHEWNRIIRTHSARLLKSTGDINALGLYKDCLLFEAPHDLDSALIYAEFDRDYKKKFYEPRRGVLLPVVHAMQRLEEREIKILGVMCPPGVGKTTLEIMFCIWSAYRHPELGILMGSHSNSLLRGVYDEIMRMIDVQGEYLWKDIFPNVAFAGTNAKEMQIDLGVRKRFATWQAASVGAGNAGRVRASNLLVLDDLVDGIESAMSRPRMDKLWQQYHTDYLQRQMDDCAQLLVATPWSIHDPIDRLERMHYGDKNAEFIHMPALDENDESNFDYPCGVGFSTDFFREQRNIMDDASWRALYMTQPIEREGQLYCNDELRRFFELPDAEPDAIFAVCDTKTTGSDFCVLPICYQYGQDYYIADVVCENYGPDTVETSVVNMLKKHDPQIAQFESNVAGGKMAQDVQKRLKDLGARTKITTKWTQANKETKIEVNAPWIKNHCLFLDESVYARESSLKEYRLFIGMLTGYTMAGKNAHDDVPDAMAQLALYAQSFGANKVEIMRRPF